jgi:hypothetical protein
MAESKGRPEIVCGLHDMPGGAMLLGETDGLVTLFGSDSHPVFRGKEIVIRVSAARIVISCDGAESLEICATTT